MTGKKIFLLFIIILIFSSMFCFGQDKTTLLDQEIQKHFNQAQALIDVRNYKYALEEYRKVFSLDRDCLEAHQKYVDCMYEYTDKNLKEAFTFYRQQIKKDKDIVSPWYIRLFGGGVKNITPVWYLGLGYCYKKIGNNDMALDNCQHACDLLSGITEKKEIYEKYYNFAKEHDIPVERRVIPLVYKVSLGALILFIIIAIVVRYYLRKKVLEKLIKLEGSFEVFDPRGFKRYMLDCSDKKLFQKYGDTIRIGSKKGCDILLKIKDEDKVYAILEAEKVGELNMITVRTTSDDVEMFLEVPKSRFTPDDMVKLPFKGSPLWDRDIINIKDYRIFYHNVKLGKRLWKDYPESAKGFLFVDPDTPQEVELPDMALLQSKLVPEEDQFYNPYEDLSKTVKTIITNVDKDEEEEPEYDFEPMDEKYINEDIIGILPPSDKETGSDVLTYKTDEEEEEYYYDEDITLPEQHKTDDILSYPAEAPVDDNEEVYEFEEIPVPEKEKSEEVLAYPSEEDDEYEIDVLTPVETVKKPVADVLTYSTEEDLKDEEYEFEEIMPEETHKTDEILSYPVPTEEDDEMMAYAETDEEHKDSEQAESLELLEHYPSHLQKINTKLDLIPYEEEKISAPMELTGIELSSRGEVLSGIQEIEIETKHEDTSDIYMEFTTPVQIQHSLGNTGVSLDFTTIEDYQTEDNIQISSLIIDDLPEEEEEDIEISAKKSSEEKKVKKKIKKKREDSSQAQEEIEIPDEKSSEGKKVKKKDREVKEDQVEEKISKKKKKKDEITRID